MPTMVAVTLYGSPEPATRRGRKGRSWREGKGDERCRVALLTQLSAVLTTILAADASEVVGMSPLRYESSLRCEVGFDRIYSIRGLARREQRIINNI